MERSGRLLARFQVITDTHVTADPQHDHNVNFGRALKDIAAQAPDSCGIMHVGDITDHGFEDEYDEMVRILKEHRSAGLTVPILFTHGNHDMFEGPEDEQLRRFERHTGMSGAYHDHWIAGYHFIFLGSEKGGIKDFAHLSVEQLQWLNGKLGEDAIPDKPVFVFLHQPLKDTVSGSLEAQGWYGVTQDEELKAVLASHPQAILFNGHTHWELEAPRCMFDGAGQTATVFNAASVGYLWTDEDEYKAGSQGLYVEIYDDRIVIRGRDFAEGAWLDNARFEVRLPAIKT
jgi:Icc protein